MAELREDYVLDRWVIIAEKRGKRPHEFLKPQAPGKTKFCFFCPGNEDSTPEEIGRIEKGGKWIIRWFPNKFAAVDATHTPEIRDTGISDHGHAFGSHEVIVETNDHEKQLHDLSVSHISQVLRVYEMRIRELSRMKGIKYVTVFKNHGLKAGTSLVHSHSQVISINQLPSLIRTKAKRSMRLGRCRYCEVLKREQHSKRLIDNSGEFVTIAPYASRYNYEAWIFPKRHVTSLSDLTGQEYTDCARHIRKVISKLAKIGASYNMFVHYAPRGTKMHMHIEITPRVSDFAGFEISTGIIINSVSPETAARFYNGKKA